MSWNSAGFELRVGRTLLDVCCLKKARNVYLRRGGGRSY